MNVAEAAIAAGVAGVHLVALLVLLWALFGDPSRGRRRCPTCAYDMGGNPEPLAAPVRCPECGGAVANERVLRRTRRKWRLATLMILAQIGAGYFWWQRQPGRGGWRGLIPNAVLIELVDDPLGRGVLADALQARERDGQLSPRQQKRIVERAVDRWINRGGPAALISTRSDWPIGEPLHIDVDRSTVVYGLQAWFSYRFDAGPGVATTRGFGTHPPQVHINWGRSPPSSPVVVTEPVREGVNRYDVTLRLNVASDGTTTPDWSFERTVAIPFSVIGHGSADDYVAPTPSRAVEGLLASQLTFITRNRAASDAPPDLWLAASFDLSNLPAWDLAWPNGVTTYDLILERGGVPLAEVEMIWLRAAGDSDSLWAGAALLPLSDPALAEVLTNEHAFLDSPLEVRFRSRRAPWAARYPTVTRSWDGDFSLPLSCFQLDMWWDTNRGTYMEREPHDPTRGK